MSENDTDGRQSVDQAADRVSVPNTQVPAEPVAPSLGVGAAAGIQPRDDADAAFWDSYWEKPGLERTFSLMADGELAQALTNGRADYADQALAIAESVYLSRGLKIEEADQIIETEREKLAAEREEHAVEEARLALKQGQPMLKVGAVFVILLVVGQGFREGNRWCNRRGCGGVVCVGDVLCRIPMDRLPGLAAPSPQEVGRTPNKLRSAS